MLRACSDSSRHRRGRHGVRTQDAVAGSRAPRARQGRALSSAERAGRGGEHLPAMRCESTRTTRRRSSRCCWRSPTSSTDDASAVCRGAATSSPGCATTTSAPTTPGIVYERRAKALLRHGTPGCGPRAYEWLREAMTLVRAGRSHPAARQRRCAASLECVRPADHARPAPRAGGRGARRAAAAGVTETRTR